MISSAPFPSSPACSRRTNCARRTCSFSIRLNAIASFRSSVGCPRSHLRCSANSTLVSIRTLSDLPGLYRAALLRHFLLAPANRWQRVLCAVTTHATSLAPGWHEHRDAMQLRDAATRSGIDLYFALETLVDVPSISEVEGFLSAGLRPTTRRAIPTPSQHRRLIRAARGIAHEQCLFLAASTAGSNAR